MTYVAADRRYDGRMPYRRVGRSGLHLPLISLGLWQNFGGVDVFETGRAMLRRGLVEWRGRGLLLRRPLLESLGELPGALPSPCVS